MDGFITELNQTLNAVLTLEESVRITNVIHG